MTKGNVRSIAAQELRLGVDNQKGWELVDITANPDTSSTESGVTVAVTPVDHTVLHK